MIAKEKSKCWCGMPLPELLVGNILQILETMQTIVFILSCESQLDSEFLLLRTLHKMITGHGEIKVLLTMKLPMC